MENKIKDIPIIKHHTKSNEWSGILKYDGGLALVKGNKVARFGVKGVIDDLNKDLIDDENAICVAYLNDNKYVEYLECVALLSGYSTK